MKCPDRLGTRIATLQALEDLKSRLYFQLAYPSSDAVYNLICLAIDNIDTLPIDKLSRWLGYAQCYVTINGLGTVEELRNRTRTDFHCGYELDGIDIPPTMSAINYVSDPNRSATLTEILSELAQCPNADMPAILNTLQSSNNVADLTELCSTLLALTQDNKQ